jgi:type I restriction enzyme S subunit
MGWRKSPVRDLIERKFTGPSPTCDERPVANDEEWGLLKTTAVTWDGWNEFAHKVPPSRYWGNESIEVHPGDVLITKAGPRHRVGVVVHVQSTRPHIMVSGKMVGLRPKRSAVLPQILAGLLSTKAAQEYLNTRTTGMAESQTNFADEALLTAELTVPTMPEQCKIAEILDTIDDQIASSKKIRSKLRLENVGVLDQLVRALPPAEFVSLSDLCTADICYGIVQSGAFVPGGVPVLAIRDLQGDFETGVHRTSRSIDAQYNRSRVTPGDVLLSIKGTIGRVGVAPDTYDGNISREIARIRLSSRMDPHFACNYLLSREAQGRLDLAVVGTTRAEISIHVLKKFSFPSPDFQYQRKVAQIMSELQEREGSERIVLAKLQAVRRGLLEDLLSGRVRVPIEADS